MKRRLTSLFSIFCIPMMACGSDGGDGGGGGGFEIDPAGTHTQYVADTVSIPAKSGQAGLFALDIDKDGRPDNGLGGTLSALANSGNIDLQAAVTDGVNAGSIIVLADLQATALDSASGVGISFYLGENPNPAACTDVTMPNTCGKHLMGDASFGVAAGSPSDALIGGALIGGKFETQAPGTVALSLNLVDGQAPLEVKLIGAHTEFSVKADGTMSGGKLVGAITKDDADNKLLPAISKLITDLIADDCMGTDPTCCTAGSTGETLLNLIKDPDKDCKVTTEEIAANPIISSLLAPDVDMLNGTTFDPGVDEIDDAISLGLGFSTVGATFTRP